MGAQSAPSTEHNGFGVTMRATYRVVAGLHVLATLSSVANSDAAFAVPAGMVAYQWD